MLHATHGVLFIHTDQCSKIVLKVKPFCSLHSLPLDFTQTTLMFASRVEKMAVISNCVNGTS